MSVEPILYNFFIQVSIQICGLVIQNRYVNIRKYLSYVGFADGFWYLR